MELMMKAFLGLLIGMVKFYWDFTVINFDTPGKIHLELIP